MYGSNNVEFMGVLVDRQYTAGQKCAQLVFETAEGIRLSLSRNINMARALRLGLTYRVKGAEHTVGQKRYIHEPTATLVPAHNSPSLFRNYKILIPAVIGLFVILGGAGTLAYAAYSANNSQPAVSEQKPAAKSAPENAASASASTPSQPTPDATSPSTSQQQTRVASTSSAKKSTVSSSTTKKTAQVTSNVVAPVTNDTPSLPASQDDTVPTPPVEQVPEDTQTPPVEQPNPDPVTTP
jgi:cytoskeletal protein RodZ